MFLTKTDYIIIMEMSEKPISIPDLLKLQEAGIETVFLVTWANLNMPWEIFLNRIDSIVQETSLKVMIVLFYAPKYDWWLIPIEHSSPSHRIYRHIDYQNLAVGRSIDRCLMDLLAKIDRTRVQLIFSGTLGGEFLWEDNSSSCPLSLEALIKFIIDRQRICANQNGEVWMTHHHMLGGNLVATTAINEALYAAFPTDEYEHYRIQYVQFAPTASIEMEEFNKKAILGNSRAKYFVGSEWVEGLKSNYEKAIEHGAYGFLTAPMHTYIPYTQIEDWMLNNIKETVGKLSSVRNN